MKTFMIVSCIVLASILTSVNGQDSCFGNTHASIPGSIANCAATQLSDIAGGDAHGQKSLKPVFSLKTNMLFDAALIPNLGVEVAFADRYSAALNWMYAWWSKDSKHRYWRIYGGDIEIRRWFGGNAASPMSGHHAGAFFQMNTYDFEFGNKGYISDSWNYGVGVSYGYSFSLNNHLNLDCSLSVGYNWGRYKKYHEADGCYVWDSTNRRRYFGPSKAEISLVYFIGGKKKGGSR